MKLQTSIPPRADGTVIVEGFGPRLEFVADAEGQLTCDVVDERVAAALLASGGDFYPADAADFEIAASLTQFAGADAADGQDLDLEDDSGDLNALPLEAGTPPKAKSKAKA